MKEIQYEIKQEIAVLSKSDSGYTKEIWTIVNNLDTKRRKELRVK